jgi:hypothetical protein
LVATVFRKKAVGREVDWTSVDSEMRKNWSHTQQTTSRSCTAAWNKRIISSSCSLVSGSGNPAKSSSSSSSDDWFDDVPL